MDEQPVGKVWVCKKSKPFKDSFLTRNGLLVREARKNGWRCDRRKSMEK